MIDFVETNEEELSPFEQYYLSDIVPAVDDMNRFKDKYRSKFWGYFWTVLFLMCANLLFCLFGALFNDHPISYEQIFLVNVVALIIMFFPLYQYKKAPKLDIFDTFLNFYGNWTHAKNPGVAPASSPIVPPHDFTEAQHNVVAEYPEWSLEMCDVVYKAAGAFKKIHFKRTVSSGVLLSVKLKQNFYGTMYMFDKKGFYRKNKFADLPNVKSYIAPPMAECFHIFADKADFAVNMLPTLFFERIFDLKEIYGAKRVYVEMRGNLLRIYFEGAQLYIENNGIWSRKINKEKFVQLNNALEQTMLFIETIQMLQEQHDGH